MLTPDPRQFLLKVANTRMPFGKYQGRLLVELPEPYLVWYKQKGFPKGELGQMLEQMYEIKLNGLESLIWPLVKR
ncbi:DUF3820 family protein [uncultured Acetobacteroides sp.]|jgi:Uncharacterized protein conserved in bacteria|uniref:DUF3820 family protein n=1 Tax=uncultured Acetobacteroides sp. TaxID=1760811 RepID=UPI0029F4F52B|nr:DUF3820 family protein [uncultured Acetobacteroides sp.]